MVRQLLRRRLDARGRFRERRAVPGQQRCRGNVDPPGAAAHRAARDPARPEGQVHDLERGGADLDEAAAGASGPGGPGGLRREAGRHGGEVGAHHVQPGRHTREVPAPGGIGHRAPPILEQHEHAGDAGLAFVGEPVRVVVHEHLAHERGLAAEGARPHAHGGGGLGREGRRRRCGVAREASFRVCAVDGVPFAHVRPQDGGVGQAAHRGRRQRSQGEAEGASVSGDRGVGHDRAIEPGRPRRVAEAFGQRVHNRDGRHGGRSGLARGLQRVAHDVPRPGGIAVGPLVQGEAEGDDLCGDARGGRGGAARRLQLRPAAHVARGGRREREGDPYQGRRCRAADPAGRRPPAGPRHPASRQRAGGPRSGSSPRRRWCRPAAGSRERP